MVPAPVSGKMSAQEDAASHALARQLAQEEARSPVKRDRKGGSKVEAIDLCTPEESGRKRAWTTAPDAAERTPLGAARQQLTVATAPALCGQEGWTLPEQHENWTCGYANLGALLQCLASGGRQQLPTSTEPAALQALIERAWEEGFDPEGRAEFGGRLVGKRGKRGWIGTPEMAAVLWHLRVDALLVEVDNEQGAGRDSGNGVFEAVRACLAPGLGSGLRPSAAAAAAAAAPAAPARGDSVTSLPIILQGDGHSRTVLGLSGSSAASPHRPELVLSDPRHAAGVVRGEGLRKLDGKSYQLVVVRGDGQRRLSEAEARSRRGAPMAAALWRQGKWRTAAWCPLNFN